MAKNRNKKKSNKDAPAAMDVSADTPGDAPQAMDTSEGNPSSAGSGDAIRKIKKGVPMKRSKNLRKLKAVAKAIAKHEKAEEKVSKKKSKTQRVQSAKTLYD